MVARGLTLHIQYKEIMALHDGDICMCIDFIIIKSLEIHDLLTDNINSDDSR
jgi:hypothetical protein